MQPVLPVRCFLTIALLQVKFNSFYTIPSDSTVENFSEFLRFLFELLLLPCSRPRWSSLSFLPHPLKAKIIRMHVIIVGILSADFDALFSHHRIIPVAFNDVNLMIITTTQISSLVFLWRHIWMQRNLLPFSFRGSCLSIAAFHSFVMYTKI